MTAIDGRSVVEAVGELDLAAAPVLRQAITSVEAEGGTHLILDFEGVTFMDSSCLNVLAGAAKRLGTPGLRIAGCRPNIVRLFELTGLHHVLRLHDTVSSALEAAS